MIIKTALKFVVVLSLAHFISVAKISYDDMHLCKCNKHISQQIGLRKLLKFHILYLCHICELMVYCNSIVK